MFSALTVLAKLSAPKIAAPVVIFAGALLLFSAVDHNRGPASHRPTRLAVNVPFGASTDQRIAALQGTLRAGPSAAGYAALGSAYLQKVRENGDASYYRRAEGVLRLSRARDPGNLDAIIGLGTLALARHDFRGGLAFGRQARRLGPTAYSPFPVIVDALVELGRYDEAGRVLQHFVDQKPGLPAYARVSYFRELHGDLTGAIQAMRFAVSAGSATPEGAAYVQTLLGTLEFNRGQISAARAAYRAALRAQPDYPAAVAGRAQTDAARGHLGRAIADLRRVVDRLPLPQYVVALGENELAAGRTRRAREDLALVPVERRLLAANGVNTDVDLALFEADHGDQHQGVLVGRRAWAAAPSVRSADALGWALTRAGHPMEGDAWARRALRLGWREPLALYHAGMTARLAGHPARARALLGLLLKQSPRFSALYAPRARAALRQLR